MKGNDDIKLSINQRVTAIGMLSDTGIYDIADESKVRIVVENAGGGNTVVVRGRIKGQVLFTNIKTLSGSDNQVVNVFTYDEIQIECTVFTSLSDYVKVIASSFNPAGGSAIESIGVLSGDTLTDIEALILTSSDSSVQIIGDNTTKTIDLKVSPTFGGSYILNFVVADWVLGADYTITIPQATHLKGTSPKEQIFEKIGADHSPILCDIEIDAAGNVVITTSPDLRFDGRIIIF